MTAQSHNTFQEGPTGLSTRERDDNYQAVVHRHGSWRVIICKDGIQWIIQRAKKAGTERRWHAVSYVTSRFALMRLWSSLTGVCGQSASDLSDQQGETD